jgi:hypothetical protein
MPRFLVLLLAPVLTTACMSAPMDHGDAQMRSAVTEAKQETSQHVDRCRGAGTMDNVVAERERHEQAMNGIFGRMDGAMGEMHGMNCSGPDMDGMMQTLSGMRAEMKAHHGGIDAAQDVGAAHDECSRYGEEMTGLCTTASRQNSDMGCM